MILLGLVLSSVAGVLLGLVGGGGSLLIVPILHYVMGLAAQQATFTSLVVVGSVSTIGAWIHYRSKTIDIKRGALFAVPAIAGVLFSRQWLLPSLPEKIHLGSRFLTKDAVVLLTFGIVMLAAAASMLGSQKVNQSEIQKLDGARRLKTVLWSLAVGVLTGFVGAGGGFLIVPALVSLFNMSMTVAVGTSLAVIAINSLVGIIATSHIQAIPVQLVFFVTCATLVGFFIGQSSAKKFSNKQLKVVFSILLLAVASFMIVRELI